MKATSRRPSSSPDACKISETLLARFLGPLKSFQVLSRSSWCCRQSRCHYLDGGCLSSPRWTSLLVAEIFYPDTFLEENQTAGIGSGTRDPVAGSPPPVHDFQNYQQYLQKRASTGEARNNGSSQQHHCDGVDEMGCFQVRSFLQNTKLFSKFLFALIIFFLRILIID